MQTCLHVVKVLIWIKKEASKYFKDAADKGLASSMYNYGKMLAYGDDIPKNIEEAIKYLSLAFNNGCTYALNDKINCFNSK